jgi:hypothetical protein
MKTQVPKIKIENGELQIDGDFKFELYWYISSKGIWLTMLMRGVQLNSLTALNAGTTALIASYTML